MPPPSLVLAGGTCASAHRPPAIALASPPSITPA